MASRSSTTHTNAQNAQNAQKPKQAIRRFDIFGEYNQLKGLAKGMDAPHAKGYGLCVAKVVASGGGSRASRQHAAPPRAEEEGERQEAHTKQEWQAWHELDGEPQTDALFDREIIQRMGRTFYTHVFAPAIAQAVNQGRSYESIRDTIGKDWTPDRS